MATVGRAPILERTGMILLVLVLHKSGVHFAMIDANLEIWIFHVHHYLAPDLEFSGPLSCFSKTLLSGRKSQTRTCVSRASPPDVLHIPPPPPTHPLVWIQNTTMTLTTST